MPDRVKNRPIPEAEIIKQCLIALSEIGCTVWRNNTGALPDVNGRQVRFGLCEGSSDIIGMAPDGRFLAVECKRIGGRVTPAQGKFLDAVRRKGGLAGIVTSAADAVFLVQQKSTP